MRKQLVAKVILLVLLSPYANAAYLPAAKAKHGMVVTPQHHATAAGLAILRQGGNAVDAAVAAAYALAVVQPCCGNLGGGGFMVFHPAQGKNTTLNFRETAPQQFKRELFFNQGQFIKARRRSIYAVGTPGTVKGLNAALTHYGTLPLSQVMAPAIRLAEQGFVLNRWDAARLAHSAKYFRQHPKTARIFLNHGKPYQPGDRLRQPQLAKTLKAIRDHGDQVFYQGWIARDIVATSRRLGGVLTMKDLQNYRVTQQPPLSCRYRGFTILTMPLPGSGVIVCEILKIAEGFPLSKFGLHSADSVHVNVEAMRLAFKDRNLLGDPAFVKVPINKLLSPQHLQQQRQRINLQQALPSGDSSSFEDENPHTTHLSVVDRQGNAVALTLTLNGFYGSYVVADKAGFLLNNELDDFNLNPGKGNMYQLVQGKANLPAPGKRPLSAMSPTVVLDGQHVVAVLGAAGGPTIITSVVQTLQHLLDFQLPLNAAVNYPRYHMQWLPNTIFMEPHTFSADTLQRLKQKGHRFTLGSPYHTQYWGQVAAIYCPSTKDFCLGANDNRYPSGLASGLP